MPTAQKTTKVQTPFCSFRANLKFKKYEFFPSARLGEEVCAYVQLIDGETITDEEIKKYALEGLAKYKVPKYVKAADEFPMTVTGKVKKFELRKLAMKDFPELEDELK